MSDDHGRKQWRRVEYFEETFLAPHLKPGTLSNYCVFEATGEDAEGAVAHEPRRKKDEDDQDEPEAEYVRAMTAWAGDAFLYQMGFFNSPGEVCCELKDNIKLMPDENEDELDAEGRSELTNWDICWLVFESMKTQGLEPAPTWLTNKKPKLHNPIIPVSERLKKARRVRRSRSKSPARAFFALR